MSSADTTSWIKQGDLVAGQYRVDAVIGSGPLGVVVAATHASRGQRVAVKLLRPGLALAPGATDRFLVEARAASGLRGPGVARLLEAGCAEGGAPFAVSELLDGRDLGALVRRDGPLPVGTTVDYLLQACDALVEAHGAGIAHGGLSPANLMLVSRPGAEPIVKVLDLGWGPLRAHPAHARADVFALGATAYELLGYRSEPAPGTAKPRPEVPPLLLDVLDRCLHEDPAARFASVPELARALAPFSSVCSTMPSAHGLKAVIRAIPEVRIVSGPPPGGVSRGVAAARRSAATFGTAALGPVRARPVVFITFAIVIALALAILAVAAARWAMG